MLDTSLSAYLRCDNLLNVYGKVRNTWNGQYRLKWGHIAGEQITRVLGALKMLH